MKTTRFLKSFSTIAAVLACLMPLLSGFAQAPYTPDVGNVGLPDNGVFHGGSIDSVQLNTGNLHIDIPLLHLPGIGMDTDIHLTYDSQIWNQSYGPLSPTNPQLWTLITMSRPPWQPNDSSSGYMKWGQHTMQWNCDAITGSQYEGGGTNTDIDFMSFTDGDGTAHPMPVSGMLPSGTAMLCGVNGVTGTWPKLDTISGDSNQGYYPVYPADLSGYLLVVNSGGSPTKFIDKHGTRYTFAATSTGGAVGLLPPLASTSDQCNGSACGSQMNPGGATNTYYMPVVAVEDFNGNKISRSSSGSTATITDTVNRQITETFTPSSSCPAVPSSPSILPIMSDSIVQTPNTIQYTDENGSQIITICYGLAPVSLAAICLTSTNCGSQAGENTVSGALLVPTEIILQNNDKYIFSYTPNPGDTYSMGEITSITLPTGGTISYTYGGTESNNLSFAPFAGRQVLSRTVTDGNQSSTWTYSYGNLGTATPGTVAVTDPYGNDTVYTLNSNPTGLANGGSTTPGYVTQEVSYNGSALSQNPIATKQIGYTLAGQESTGNRDYYQVISEKLTWNSSNATTETDTTWDTFSPLVGNPPSISLNNVMSKVVYDYGTGTHGALLRNTQYSYLHQNNSSYVAPNILDRVAQTSVYNSLTVGSSSLVAQATTGYDGFSQTAQNGLASVSGTAQHDSSYGTGYTLRGLPTSVTKYVSSSSSISAYTNYNILGKPTVTTDGRGNSTTYQYDTAHQNAFLTSTTMPSTNGTSHIIHETHDVNTGLLISKSDQNGNTTSYTYDSRMRPLVVTRPPNMGSNLGGGTTTNSYPDPNHVNSVTTLDASRAATTVVTLDGLGRKILTNSTSDATCGPLTVNTAYDLMGRVQTVSNPHCTSSQATDGYSTYTYDAIGRLTNKLNPDGSSQNWSFNGNIIDFYDETTRHWQHTYDAEDRLTKVLEPNGTTTITIAPTLETDYSYDTLGDLLRVDQWGGANGSGNDHVRTFAYDGLSRLVASNNPESASNSNPAAQSCAGTTSGTHWTTCYAYDNNSNLQTKTDNRGISITYSYDALNRLLGKTYSDSTPPVTYAYDTSSLSGSSNDIGELTQATVKSGSTTLAQINTYGYDTMGRLLLEQQCTPATNCTSSLYQLGYTYDYAGKPLSGTFPSNVGTTGQPLLLTYTYDSAERLLTASSNWASSSDTKHPGTLFQASNNASLPGYGPMGLLNADLGINSNAGTTTANMQRTYDNRSRITNGIYTAGASPVAGSASTGTVTISGTEAQVTKTNTAGSATASITPSGYGGTYQSCGYVTVWENGIQTQQWQCTTQPNYGTIQITVQSNPPFTVTASWQNSTTLTALATSLATLLNASGSPVTAVAHSNGTLTITSASTGVNTNYPVTVTSILDP